MKIIKAPNKHNQLNGIKIFLAGSIEMGAATKWQDKVTKQLELCQQYTDEELIILNPRRDDWDSSWEQSINNLQFSEQVNWELDSLEDSDIIVLWFDENTKSPISLLEFGLFAASKKIIVYCPDKFWRKGNIDIVCQRNEIECYNQEEVFFYNLKNFVKSTINFYS